MLARYRPVGLDGIADRAITARTDTKFVLRDEDVLGVLAQLLGHYRVLDVDGLRFTSYRTQYFDTESFALFRRHHAGGANRHKVRTRTYLNTGLAYVEIKHRTKSGATTKLRRQTPDFQTELDAVSSAFVDRNSCYGAASLEPSLQNRFDRICLIDAAQTERLTIDVDLSVDTPGGALGLPRIAVAELKQERGARRSESPFLHAMHERHLRPSAFSKYCIGLLLTHPGIKHNLFKPQLKRLRRLMGEMHVAS
jgi:hypothetical protein